MFKNLDHSNLLQIKLRTKKTLDEQDKLQDNIAKMAKPEINVLYYERFNKKLSKVYLVPVFTRFMVNRISLIDLEQDFGVVAGCLFVTLRYQGIPKKYVEQLLDNLMITINDSEYLKFCMKEQFGQSYVNEQQETATYVKTMKFQALLDASVFLAPFQRIYLETNICFLPYFYEERDPKDKSLIEVVSFKFNNMIHQNLNEMFTIRSRKNAIKYGEYSLARNSQTLNVEISDNQGTQLTTSKLFQQDLMKNQETYKQEEVSMTFKEASVISFKCMLYRHPSVSIITIFVPMWILGFITLMVFFQSSNFDNKVINTATIYISFATYFQVIRSVLPKSSHISLMEIFVYSILSICILVLIEALMIRSQKSISQTFQFQRPLFLISFCIEISTFFFIMTGLVIYQYILKPSYNKLKINETPHISTKIYYCDWQNQSLREQMSKFKYDIYYADSKQKILSHSQLSPQEGPKI